MPEVMAGFICGFALSVLVTPVAAMAIIRARGTSLLMRRIVPEGTSMIAVSVIINLFAVLTLTAIGMLLGLLLAGIESSNPAGGLGSPNWIFTAFILITTLIAVLPVSIASARLRVPMIACGLVFLATFAWFMPYLASWAPIES